MDKEIPSGLKLNLDIKAHTISKISIFIFENKLIRELIISPTQLVR